MDTIYRIRYISTFYTDVADVAAYLDEYPLKAKRIFAKIDAILTNLPKMPEMYPVYDDFPIFRKIVIEDYLVFYTVDMQSKTIEIHRLLYGGMDMQKVLAENNSTK